jgi:transcriptional regulator with GAF, ATPase, and Fis domain
MGLEPGSGVSLDPNATIEQERIKRAKQNIEAGLSVSAFSSEKEEEYERSIRSVYQLQQWHFEQESLNEQKTSNNNPIEGLDKRILTLKHCQRPLFEYNLPLKEGILDHALKVVHKVINCQISAVFLIDKKGTLKRYSLHGITSLNQTIASDWFPDEEYSISIDSFVGKTALGSHVNAQHPNTSQFGELHYSYIIEQDLKNIEDNLAKYKEDCGEIYQVAALPINNHYRTIGVLRIINKVDPSSQKILKNDRFSDTDLIYLSLFASEIGTALLNFERDSNRRLFSALMKDVCRPESPNVIEKDLSHADRTQRFIDNALNKLVKNESSPFNFAILRFLCNDKKLCCVASVASYDHKLNESRDNNPIEINKHDSFVSYVVTTQQYIVISDISSRMERFNNKPWVKKQEFSTFCCFPLQCREKDVFGTLSLYTAYRYKYDAKSTELIQSFCDALSALLYLEKLDPNSKKIKIDCDDIENIKTSGNKILPEVRFKLACKLFLSGN